MTQHKQINETSSTTELSRAQYWTGLLEPPYDCTDCFCQFMLNVSIFENSIATIRVKVYCGGSFPTLFYVFFCLVIALLLLVYFYCHRGCLILYLTDWYFTISTVNRTFGNCCPSDDDDDDDVFGYRGCGFSIFCFLCQRTSVTGLLSLLMVEKKENMTFALEHIAAWVSFTFFLHFKYILQ